MTDMLKLWIDDIRPAPEGWHRVKTVTEAIRILDEQEVSEVSLDHDISMKVSIGYGDARPFASPETYEPVARFVRQLVVAAISDGEVPLEARMSSISIKKVYLHSANPVGREKMRAILAPVSRIIEVVETPSKPCNRFEFEHTEEKP